MGLWSAFFVVRRYEQAQRLAWLLGAMWLFLGLLALLRRKLPDQPSRWQRIVAFVLAWVEQSASQEILFFVLPFWIRSTTWNSPNAVFTVLLIALAGTTVFDPLYLWILARLRLAMLHKSLVQFAALAFLVPVATGIHTLAALALAGGLAGLVSGFAFGSRRPWPGPAMGTFAGALLAVAGSSWIAPVPMRLERGVFTSGISQREPVDTLRTCPPGRTIWAWTPVFAPRGMRDSLVHAWHRDGHELSQTRLVVQGGRMGGFRTWSASGRAAAQPGWASLEVRTTAGQIVGRMSIPVK
jgi:hypothetical protein